MITALPGSPLYDIASTTQVFMTPYVPVVVLGGGVFLAFFVIQFIVELLAERWYPTQPRAPEHSGDMV